MNVAREEATKKRREAYRVEGSWKGGYMKRYPLVDEGMAAAMRNLNEISLRHGKAARKRTEWLERHVWTVFRDCGVDCIK